MSSKAKRRKSRRDRIHRRTQPGAPPGIVVADPAAPHPVITAIAFGPEGFVEEPVRDVRQQVPPLIDRWPVTWINVDGLGDTATIQDIGEIFGLHKLALEDVVNTHQRAKAEYYGDRLFVVARMPLPQREWDTEQLSMFVGEKFVVTFQERSGGDCLDPVRTRIRAGLARGKSGSPAHLMYAILDALIDNYFPLLEDCGERIDRLEEDVLTSPDRSVMERILSVKRDLRMVRRAAWPLRDAVNTLLREPTPLVTDDTRVYLRDCHDHVIQILDLLENYREIAGGLTDVHLSTLSNTTNEVVKVLTIISTLFIPLTFLVGVYGMNFDVMPELRWKYGYPLTWAVMLVTVAGLLVFFRRRGWLGRRRTAPRGDESG